MSAVHSPTPESAALLQVRNLTVELPGEHSPLRVVDNVSFDLSAGEIIGLVGESGSGKSMTALSLLGLIRPIGGKIVAGSIEFDGLRLHDMSERALDRVRGDHLTMIFQEPMSCLDPLYPVGEQIAEIARRHLGLSRRAAAEKALEMLDRVAIPDPRQRSKAYPHQLSGGMRQRVMIAMALICDPKLLIADEPTTALDVSVQAEILELLRTLSSDLGLAVLFITHDLGVVAELCDRALVMYAGELIEVGSVSQLLTCPHHPYTAGLLNSVPTFGPRKSRMEFIPGRIPSPGHMPEGCRFGPRCGFQQSPGCAERQVLASLDDASQVRCVRSADLSFEQSLE